MYQGILLFSSNLRKLGPDLTRFENPMTQSKSGPKCRFQPHSRFGGEPLIVFEFFVVAFGSARPEEFTPLGPQSRLGDKLLEI